jgi:hypothetical protein
LVEAGNKVTCDMNIYCGIGLLQLPTESVRADVENSYAVPLNLFYIKLHVMRRIKKCWTLLALSLNIYRVETFKSHILVYLKTLMRFKYITMGE